MAARAANGQIAGPGASKASVETDYTKEDFRTAQLLNQDAPRSPFTMESQSGIMGVDKSERSDINFNLELQQNGQQRQDIDLHNPNLLPNYDKAIIPIEKLTGYALNPNHSIGKNKARVFERALGYNASNADQLLQNIKDNLYRFEALEKPDLGYGKLYQVDMELTGPNGNTAMVRTAWILDRTTGEMRLTSTYVLD